MTATPRAAAVLLRKLDGWSTQLRTATGQCAFGTLSADTDGNGKRHRVEVLETVDSVLIRARHVDGRALVALWIRRRRAPGWTLDLAWRARHHGELAPRPITARQLTAYAGAPDPESALAACAPMKEMA